MAEEKADLTVVMERNESVRKVRYGADAIHTCFIPDEDGGRKPGLVFMCSGGVQTVPADEVESIEVSTGKTVCMTCER
mgnify:CR=1 FL=1